MVDAIGDGALLEQLWHRLVEDGRASIEFLEVCAEDSSALLRRGRERAIGLAHLGRSRAPLDAAEAVTQFRDKPPSR
eukprot:4582431-Prymnesium_polylepis.1